MKMIYRDRNLTRCDMVRCVLESLGIPVILKNEFASQTAGASIVGSLVYAWPEVWVHDEDVEAALSQLQQADLRVTGDGEEESKQDGDAP